MALGELLSSANVGTEFAKALSVKAKPPRKGFIEGLEAAQRNRIAQARAGVPVQNDINRMRNDAAKSIKGLDTKIQKDAVANFREFSEKADEAVTTSSDVYAAQPLVRKAYDEFQAKRSTLEGINEDLKRVRAQTNDKTRLVPGILTEYLQNDEASFKDDGLIHLPGWNSYISEGEQKGRIAVNLPRKVDLKNSDQLLLQSQPDEFYRQNAEGNPAVETRTVNGTVFEYETYKLSKNAIRQQVLAAAQTNPDYLANISYDYYLSKREEPGFAESVKQKELDGTLSQEIISHRVESLYNLPLTKGIERRAAPPTRVSVEVDLGQTAASGPAYSAPVYMPIQISQQTATGDIESGKSIPAIGYTITADNVTLPAVDGMIDMGTNTKLTAPGNLSNVKASALLLVPTYKNAQKFADAQARDVYGKAVDRTSIDTELTNNNVRFNVFAQSSTSEKIVTGNTTREGANFLYPSQSFWSANAGGGTKASALIKAQELKSVAELYGVRDMLNGWQHSERVYRDADAEAIRTYRALVSNPGNQELNGKLITLAYEKGYMKPYLKGSTYSVPEMAGQQTQQTRIGEVKPRPSQQSAKPPAKTPAKTPAKSQKPPATPVEPGKSRRSMAGKR